MVSESIIEMMKEYRKKRGWDLRAFGERLDVSKKTVWRYENGEAFPTIEVIERFAKMMGKTVAELLKDEETEAQRKRRRFLDDVWDAHQAHFGR